MLTDDRPALGQNLNTNKPFKTMIVDDSRTLRLVLKQNILSWKFDLILEAENGKDALLKIDAAVDKPDIIFVDVEMPEMSGIELVGELRKRQNPAKIIMVTGNTDPDVVKQLVALGISGYVVKPFERTDLLGRIAKALGRGDLANF